MGINGTEAAKEAAEMVLADDNFASIANAVEEGRTAYDNLKKAILFILPTNGGEALVPPCEYSRTNAACAASGVPGRGTSDSPSAKPPALCDQRLRPLKMPGHP